MRKLPSSTGPCTLGAGPLVAIVLLTTRTNKAPEQGFRERPARCAMVRWKRRRRGAPGAASSLGRQPDVPPYHDVMALPAPDPRSTCLVTGASSGIGAEIARALAARHHGVTLVARRGDRLRHLADELVSRYGVRAEVVAADLSDPEARAGLPAAVEERRLVVEVLVNNAGFSTTGPVARATRQRELDLVRTDVEAVVDLCTLLVGGMVTRGRGAVLNVASTAGFQPLPGQAAYGAAKAFVLSYTEALRAELRGTGVSATALCPGPVATEFNEVAGVSDDEAASALPRFMWVPATEVARAAVDGLEHDRAVVIPGWANRFGALAGHLVPNSLVLPLLAGRHPGLRAARHPPG